MFTRTRSPLTVQTVVGVDMGGHNGFSSSADDIVTYEHIISQEFLTKNSNLMEICAERHGAWGLGTAKKHVPRFQGHRAQ
jgi:hypothetical protein